MRIFTDVKHRRIELAVTDEAVARVKDRVGVDLSVWDQQVPDSDGDIFPLLRVLQGDVLYFASVLFWVCYPSLTRQSIDFDEFAESMGPSEIQEAQVAFFTEWRAWFDVPAKSVVVQKLGNLIGRLASSPPSR